MAPTTPKHGLLLIYLLSLASAQGTLTELKSCVDVNCPVLPSSTVAECRVKNHTLSAVGVSPFNFTIGNESGAPQYPMAWTVGVQEVPLSEVDKGPDHDDTNFTKIERTYFLGSPKEVDLTDNKTLGGCALYLEARFTSNPVVKDQNPCSLMSPTCESALLSLIADGVSTASGRKSFRDAANLTNSADDSIDTHTCNMLAEALNKRVYPGLEDIGECQGVFNISAANSEDYSWETWEVKGTPLTGLSAIPPPSPPSNDTCHPTLPQTNNMYRIWTTATQIPRTDGGLEIGLEGVVPIISVFWEKNENGTVGVQDEVAAAARWSCIAPVNPNKADDGTKDGAEGAAARWGGSGALVSVLSAIVVGTVATWCLDS